MRSSPAATKYSAVFDMLVNPTSVEVTRRMSASADN